MRTQLEVDVPDTDRATALLLEAGFESHIRSGGLVLRETRALRHPELVATALVRAGAPPTRLALAEEDLETYFLRLVTSAGAQDLEVADAR